MKFYILVLDGTPRLDVTGKTKEEASTRAAKVLGGQAFQSYKQSDKVRFVRVKLEVLV